MPNCAVLDDYQRVALECADWGSLGDSVRLQCFHEPAPGPDALAAMLAPFEIVIAMRERTPFPASLIDRLPALRLLVTTGMRNASIDLRAAQARGITVCGTGSHPGSTAELAWGLILALARRLPEELSAVRNGRWQTTLGRSLDGATLGIVGMGRIGAHMAAIGRAFGMQVIGWSRSLTEERASALGARRAESLAALMRVADILTLHVTLNDGTRGMIGARELALMKRDALLVNTSRGPVVDERALVDALAAGRLAGAALDVYDREPPPPDHPLRTMRNVIATPHLGYVTRENYRKFYGDAVEDIRAWLDGRPVRTLAAEAP